MAKKDDSPQTEQERQAAEMQVQDTPATDDKADPPEGDGGESSADAAVEGAGEDKPEKAETPRDRLARRFAEKRREEMGDQTGTVYDQAAAEEAAEVADDKPVAAATDDKVEKPAPTVADKPEEGDDPVVKLKVHGRDIELPLSEVRKQAQINLATSAGERALSDLTRQIQERRAELETLSKPAPQDTATNGDGRQAPKPTEKAPAEPTQLDQARLAELVEDIRNGTDEEATKAFSTLVSEITASIKPTAQADTVDIATVVAQHVQAQLLGDRERTTINEALQQFATDYPDIAKDEDFEGMAYTRAVAEMLDDIKKAGVSEQLLAALRNANVTEVVDAHRKLRDHVDKATGARPYAEHIRPYGTILKAAGDHVMTKIGKPPAAAKLPATQVNGNGLDARTDRKRGLQPQPRTTGARTQAEAATPPGGKPDHKAAVQKIAAMRRGATVA